MTSDNTTISSTNFNVDKDGNMSCANANITGGNIDLVSSDGIAPKITIRSKDDDTNKINISSTRLIMYYGGIGTIQLYPAQDLINVISHSNTDKKTTIKSEFVRVTDGSNTTTIYPTGITTPTVTQTSLEESKKNFERLDNGLEIINKTDIYKYNLKSQDDTDKKHIGFVIGDNYKYSKEITSENNDGVDTYSMISVAYKAIQEQQELIEQLQKEIQELKGEK